MSRHGEDATPAQAEALLAFARRMPKELRNNVVLIKPSRKYLITQRSSNFYSLYRRFFEQVRYGCKEPACPTPTCFSYQKRIASGPVRRPTVTTAKILAYNLASQPNPYAALCPHEHPVPAHDHANLRLDPKSLSQNLYNTSVFKKFESINRPNTAPITAHELDRRQATPSHNRSSSKPRSTNPFGDRVVCLSHLTYPAMMILKEVGRDYGTSGNRWEAFNDVTLPVETEGLGTPMEFVNQSLFHSLSDPFRLIRSFHDCPWDEEWGSPLPHLHPLRLWEAFEPWLPINGSLIFDSLWYSLGALFLLSPNLRSRQILQEANINESQPVNGGVVDQVIDTNEYVNDIDAAHMIMICIHAITTLVPDRSVSGWMYMRASRTVPTTRFQLHRRETVLADTWVEIRDALEYEPAMRLVKRLVRAIAARRCHHECSISEGKAKLQEQKPRNTNASPLTDLLIGHLAAVTQYIRRLQLVSNTIDEPAEYMTMRWSIPSALLESLFTLFLKEWDGTPRLSRWDAVGGTLDLIAAVYKHREQLGLEEKWFRLQAVTERLEISQLAATFPGPSNPNTRHILSYRFLFNQSDLLACFRTLNYTRMLKGYQSGTQYHRMKNRLSLAIGLNQELEIQQRLKPALSTYLVLDVRRESALMDSLDQLWRRDRLELLRPLKVRIGADEGEEGLDHGGVSQEFFKVVLAEALNPDCGMFTIDPTTHMAWFQPLSVEPLHRFELLGLLVSLAVYNGITLPVTFPKALYRRLLGEPVDCIDHIRDGWPELANGLQYTLDHADGDVGDVLQRDFVFTIEAYGAKQDYHLAPDEEGNLRPAEEPERVTNANRTQFVKDYIACLTYWSVRPQYEAFARGFHTCLDSTALSLLNPALLQSLTEGHRTLDMHALEENTKYEDGYSATHPLIRSFWAIVHAWPATKQIQLLEFVTASDRVPVNGVGSIQFSIVRAGADSDRLPSSSTCYGKLLLPEYAGEEKLRRKLDVALENGWGFGVQ